MAKLELTKKVKRLVKKSRFTRKQFEQLWIGESGDQFNTADTEIFNDTTLNDVDFIDDLLHHFWADVEFPKEEQKRPTNYIPKESVYYKIKKKRNAR